MKKNEWYLIAAFGPVAKGSKEKIRKQMDKWINRGYPQVSLAMMRVKDWHKLNNGR